MNQLQVVDNVVAIPIASLVLSPTNPRGAPTEKELQDLASDIGRRGVRQAITVRTKSDKYEVVFGKRRFLASKLAKKESVPAVIKEMSDDEAYELQLIENLQRENLHPVDEAAAFLRFYKQRLRETNNHDQAVKLVAERLGKDPDFIRRSLKLNDLIDAAREAFRKGQLLLGHAEELCRVRAEEQKDALKYLLSYKEEVEGERGYRSVAVVPGVPQLKLWILQNLFLDLTKAPFDTANPKLNPKMGACSTCPFRTGNQPALFPDVQKGETCTVPECWRTKRDNTLIQIATERRKELGVAKVLMIGLGYRSWNSQGVPVDAYVEHGDSPHQLVSTGDECKKTKPGVLTFIDGNGRSSRKVGDPVLVCTDAQNCSKHNRRSAVARPKKTYEEMAGTRVQNLRSDTKQRIRAALIHAVIEAALKSEAAFSKKHMAKLQPMAWQMHSDLFFDRHRDLCKLFCREPIMDRNKSKDWRRTCKQLFAGNPMAMLVAMTLMHHYHLNSYEQSTNPLGEYIRLYRIHADQIEKKVKAEIEEKIGSIHASLRRRKEKQAKLAKKAQEAKPGQPTVAKKRTRKTAAPEK